MGEDKQTSSLDELDAKIRAARIKSQGSNGGKGALGDGNGGNNRNANNQGIGFAFRLGTELVASLIVGVGFGMLLDYWLDSKPWFLIIFFLLGAASGISSVYRAANGIDITVGYGSKNIKDDDVEL